VGQNAPVQMDQINANHVEVFFPLEQINPDEIQLEDLMDVNPDEVDQPEQHQDEQLQLGFVEMMEPATDLVFSSFFSIS
jgi:hypothetical protein